MTSLHLATRHLELSPARGLGRLFAFDPRDLEHPLAAEAPLKVTRSVAFWPTGPVLDQGATSECTAYAAEQLLMSAPIQNAMYMTPNLLYRANQLNDEWPGENYLGSSVRASMKVLQAAGLIGSYAWAFDADTVRRWVLMRGPVILGTNWYNRMSDPHPVTGFIRPQGEPIGGHAYMIRGADDNLACPDGTRGAVRIINSWGVNWGQQGKAWLSYSDLDGLIKNHGEAVTPLEVFNSKPIPITGVIA